MERECKYPGCFYYNKNAKTYCCAACSGDDYDRERLHKERKRKRRHETANPVGFPEVKDY